MQTAITTAQSLTAHSMDTVAADGLLRGLDALLCDIQHVLVQLPLAAYGAAQDGQSSIGAHMRHVLEFMQVLADQCALGLIDYECRARNPLYETDPKAVAFVLPQLQTKLSHVLSQHGADHPLMLRETVTMGGDKLTFPTSLGREMLFMLQHGTHHLAIITLQAASMNIALDGQGGVAVATVTYRQQAHA